MHPPREEAETRAGDRLGVEPWDRPEIYREASEAATDITLPYWVVLLLSGAIATLGLALDSSAVVIGAMLVAPLLSPVVGLALAFAAGDGRLAVQTAVVVLGSTVAVIAIAAALTMLLPFQTITAEISARTRPTTLDLVIAVFSGLVGAVVTVARGKRLSAAIPGVAISVALIPPLAVAGFGVGVGWNGELIRGSLLLYGANLAGIVLSGMAVFMAVGMHGEAVLETARRRHQEGTPQGLAAWADRAPGVRSLGVFRSPWARIGMVLAFAVALGFPLTETLAPIAREARVERAVSEVAAANFEVRDRASILGRQVVYGTERSQVYLRVATTEWFGRETRERFERDASARAGEPIRLSLEQLPTRSEELGDLSALLPAPDPGPVPVVATGPTDLEEWIEMAGQRLRQVAEDLDLPDGGRVVGLELGATDGGESVLRAGYAAPVPLVGQAQQMLSAQLARALELPSLSVRLTYLSTGPRVVSGEGADSLALRSVSDALRGYPELFAEVLAPAAAAAAADSAATAIAARGVSRERIRIVEESGDLRVRIAVEPHPDPPPATAAGPP